MYNQLFFFLCKMKQETRRYNHVITEVYVGTKVVKLQNKPTARCWTTWVTNIWFTGKGGCGQIREKWTVGHATPSHRGYERRYSLRQGYGRVYNITFYRDLPSPPWHQRWGAVQRSPGSPRTRRGWTVSAAGPPARRIVIRIQSCGEVVQSCCAEVQSSRAVVTALMLRRRKFISQTSTSVAPQHNPFTIVKVSPCKEIYFCVAAWERQRISREESWSSAWARAGDDATVHSALPWDGRSGHRATPPCSGSATAGAPPTLLFCY